MNKGQLVDAVSYRVPELTKKGVETVISQLFEVIQETVSTGDKVTLVGFGSFEPRDRKERQGRNPKTGETLTIPATKAIGFSAGKGFKELVNS